MASQDKGKAKGRVNPKPVLTAAERSGKKMAEGGIVVRFRIPDKTTEWKQVCADSNDGAHWYFEEKSRSFIRMKDDGQVLVAIQGKSLPDPFLLWQKRNERSGRAINDLEGKPHPVTFMLWEYWETFIASLKKDKAHGNKHD